MTRWKSGGLNAVMGILAVLAVWTLWPAPAALKWNDLGYKSACPFAPWSTLALLGAAALIGVIRWYLSASAERSG